MLRYIFLDRPGVHDHIAGWRGRCTYCGHRVGPNAVDNYVDVRFYVDPDVVETRRQPWRIPAEMVGRFLAMRHGEAELDRMDALAADVDEDTDRIFGTGGTGEPLYDLDTRTWDKACPCVLAEQRDPECPWHGREAVFVDDGLGDEFEDEAEQWDRRRD